MNRLCVLGLLIGLSRSPALAAGQGESGNPPATDKERFIASLMARMSNAERSASYAWSASAPTIPRKR